MPWTEFGERPWDCHPLRDPIDGVSEWVRTYEKEANSSRIIVIEPRNLSRDPLANRRCPLRRDRRHRVRSRYHRRYRDWQRGVRREKLGSHLKDRVVYLRVGNCDQAAFPRIGGG